MARPRAEPPGAQTQPSAWTEPPEALPLPGVTGLPLLAPPLKKIRKESLWPRRLLRLHTPVELELPTPVSTPGPVPVPAAPAVSPATLHLRRATRVVLRPPLLPTPPSPDARLKPPRARRLKIRQPKKPTHSLSLLAKPPPRVAAQELADNDDFCAACGDPGTFLCCDACPKSFHFSCCLPPYDEHLLPADDLWFCRECAAKRGADAEPAAAVPAAGMFSKLVAQMDARNPRQYALPRHVREMFEGVSTGPHGEYQQGETKVKTEPVFKTEEDPRARVWDKHREPYLCYMCGGLGLGGREVVRCSVCPLAWHLDCVQPVVTGVGSKWRCPNHVADLLPRERHLKKSRAVRPDAPCGIRNSGWIEVVSDDELPDAEYRVEADSDGVHAGLLKAALKAFSIDGVKYRLGERAIVLDFVGKVQRGRSGVETRPGVETRLGAGDTSDSFHALVRASSAWQDLDGIVEAQTGEIPPDELQDLRAIRRLLLAKGRDKVLAFLQA